MCKKRPGWLLLFLLAACQWQESNVTGNPAGSLDDHRPLRPLPAFASEAEWEQWLGNWAASTEARVPQMPSSKMQNAPAASTKDAAAAAEAEAVPEALTNMQTAGADEGGIVKLHGEHLVVLQRGRLFTIAVGGDALQPVSTIDAFAPDIHPDGAWYDEMLIAGDTVVVVGYSHSRGGTEIGLFDIDSGGRLSYRNTYQLRGSDYYAPQSYASRLIGNRLIFYMPLHIHPRSLQGGGFYPALRHWHSEETPGDFKRILPATGIYRSAEGVDMRQDDIVMHTVTRCDLSQPEMECESMAVLGPAGHVFHVSADSVYVWTTRPSDNANEPDYSTVFRIPLDGTAASALKARGAPLNPLSFLQDEGGYLNVLVTGRANGRQQCGEKRAQGETALLRVSLHDFGDGTTAAKSSNYQSLPNISLHNPQNRFIGGWLLYAGEGMDRWGDGEYGGDQGVVHALRYSHRYSTESLTLKHAVERIEAVGTNAVLVGNAGADLHFTTVRLEQKAAVMNTYVQPNVEQGETRTYGFFYKSPREHEEIIGLPIVMSAARNAADRSVYGAAVLYLRNRELQMSLLGQLTASVRTMVDDDCRANCVDWYGNARPLFIGNRIFALLGYELVEGAFDGDRIGDRRRVNFKPKTMQQIAE